MPSHGQVLADDDDDDITSPEVQGASVQTSTKTGFVASIRRRLFGFRTLRSNTFSLGRSKSLNGHAITTSQPRRKVQSGHSRSMTDLTVFQGPVDDLPTPKSRSIVVQPDAQLEQERPDSSERSGPQTAHAVGDVIVPQLLQHGTPMTKVSLKKHKKFVFRLDADLGQIVWESKKHKIIPIENIKEIRSGDDARYYREQFQLSQAYQDRWLTIVYLLDGNYKTLHLIAATTDVFRMWNQTLRDLHAIRLELMRGLGNVEMRQALWEKQYWKGANEEEDQKLTFEEVERLCRRLNINSDSADLSRLFKQADTRERNFLDFDDFRQFVKLLKARPEVDRLYNKLKTRNGGIFNFRVFEKFMKERQGSILSSAELLKIFNKYVTPSESHEVSNQPAANEMTIEGFTSFLLSPDNSVFADQQKDVWQDMTRPLPEYFISSSHNTYLVGHQLVGVSTIEGYIRALLHSCRSVELDIYDGEQEPMIFHGKTFTSKVSLREVCQTIAKYGFVASPYPIIISAEVHCSLAGQDMIAEIMIQEFGDSLVRLPLDPEGGLSTRETIEQLPSPEELRGKILLKAKNLNLGRIETEMLQENDPGSSPSYTTEPSSSTDSDIFFETARSAGPGWTSAEEDTVMRGRNQLSDSSAKGQFTRARSSFLQRVSSSATRATRGHEPMSSNLSAGSKTVSMPPVLAQMPLSPPISLVASPSSPKNSSTRRPADLSPERSIPRLKPKMSPALMALLVYTVGVKFRGINKKAESQYAVEHMFSLSENTANRQLRFGMWDLIKHTKTHLVRTYPKGTRVSSTNYEPHRFWAAGTQLVAINWQTFDLGYMINHAMFQRNGRSGYVLKPDAIRLAQKERLAKKASHDFVVTVISAQQLPRPKNASGHEVPERAIVDPYVEVTLYVPDWPVVSDAKSKDKEKDKVAAPRRTLDEPPHSTSAAAAAHAAATTLLPIVVPGTAASGSSSQPGHAISARTSVVRKNGWNPFWAENLRIPFNCVGDMLDLIFVRFVVRQEGAEAEEPLAVYCASLGSLQHGYRHLPLHDSQLSQYLFSTLFVKLNVVPRNPP